MKATVQFELSSLAELRELVNALPREVSVITEATAPAVGVRPAPQKTPDPTPATPAPPAPDDAVDADGMPWDARIHTSTRGRTQKNQWKKRKGVNDLDRSLVEEELRAAPTHVPTQSVESVEAPAPPEPPPVENLEVISLHDIIKLATSLGLVGADINTAVQLHGGAAMADLNRDPALIPAVAQSLRDMAASNE